MSGAPAVISIPKNAAGFHLVATNAVSSRRPSAANTTLLLLLLLLLLMLTPPGLPVP
jgi:hypothetical protein